jgi:hypothetical protein
LKAAAANAIAATVSNAHTATAIGFEKFHTVKGWVFCIISYPQPLLWNMYGFCRSKTHAAASGAASISTA